VASSINNKEEINFIKYRVFFGLWSSGLRHHVAPLVVTNLSEELAASIFRVEEIGQMGFLQNFGNHLRY
jgi:hypothetical protein